MRIKTLRLAAYGPFTDVTIDFGAGGTDFHLLFGPNEAGKSSTLRAVRHMLFGIPARTDDNFLHGYANLRIGAALTRGDGAEIEFVRRKGQAKTLRGPDDESVLDDEALAPFLGGVGPELFEQMFAIGHDDLIRGGEEIVSGKGRVGEALFAAGAGLIRLQGIQQGLDQECGALFKPGGSTPVINQVIAALKTERKAQKEALLLAATWQAHDRSLRQARQRMETVRQALLEHKQRVARLQRISEALPLIVRRRELDDQLAALQDLPDLPDDFGEKRRDTETELSIAIRDLERSRRNVAEIEQRIQALILPSPLLRNAAVIETLQHELGSFRKAREDRPGLEGRQRTLQRQAEQILAEIHVDLTLEPGHLPKLPPSTAAEIQDLSKTHAQLTAKLEAVAAQQRKLQNRLDQLTSRRASMPVPADTSRIEAAVQAAQEIAPLERSLTGTCAAVKALEDEIDRWLQRQTLWQGPLETIDALPLPSRETVDRFHSRLETFRQRVENTEADKAKIQGDILQIQTELEAIELTHDVPTETDLEASRCLRDQGWGLIRQTLDGDAPSPAAHEAFCRRVDNGLSLPDAFETAMDQADRMADRLRREADQVSRKGLLEARRKQLEKSLGNIEAEVKTALEEQGRCQTEWRQLWIPLDITALAPVEMRVWLTDVALVREKLATLHTEQTRCEVLTADLDAHRSHLGQALAAAGAAVDPGVSLSVLVKTAQGHVKIQQERAAHITAADREIATLKGETAEMAAEVADLHRAFDRWKNDWEKRVRKIGLPADASPAAALALIESVREARNKFNEAEVLQKRIDGIDRDAATFAARVDEQVAAAAPDLADTPRDRAAELLYARLTAARKNESKQHGLKEQREAEQKACQEAQLRISKGRALLDILCREARCQDAGRLAEIEKRVRQRDERVRLRDELDDQLRHLSAGAALETFIAEALALNADHIIPELDALADAIENLEQERSTLDQTIGIETAQRRYMDGSAAAAGHAEEAERLLAGLEADVERYARLKIAAVILARTVEQYRDKHQGPLISRAGECFSRMTGGAFRGLRAEYDEKGNPILVGIRSGTGVQVPVAGMSDGTADQLYLALRLASLEQYLETNEPLPFVVDDILLRFDDDRALATLGVLAELADKTQVLFFTHHRHLVELVRSSKAPALGFNVLSLDG